METRLSESQAEAEELNQSKSVGMGIVMVYIILPLLFPTPTIWFSLDRKQRSSKRRRTKMETILSRFYDSAYDPDLRFSQGHKRSYDSAYDPVSGSGSVASETTL